jgi:hypothetical protein
MHIILCHVQIEGRVRTEVLDLQVLALKSRDA